MDALKVRAQSSPKQRRSFGNNSSDFSVGYGDHPMHPDLVSEKSSSAKHVPESKQSNLSDVRASDEHSQFLTTISNLQFDPQRCSLVHGLINGNNLAAADVPKIQTPNSIQTAAIRARLRVVCHPSQDSAQADEFEDSLPADVSLIAEPGHNRHSQNNNEGKKCSRSMRLEIEREEPTKPSNSNTKLPTQADNVIQQAPNDSARVQQAAKVENTQKPKLPQTRSSPGSVRTSSSRSNAVELSSSLPRLHISRATSSGHQRPKTVSGLEYQDAEHEPRLADSQVIASLHMTQKIS
jgi:hypothetical protein